MQYFKDYYVVKPLTKELRLAVLIKEITYSCWRLLFMCFCTVMDKAIMQKIGVYGRQPIFRYYV